MSNSKPSVAVVTGGTGGMGQAIARRLGTDGPVVIADLSADAVDSVVADLRASGIDAVGQAADIADPDAVSELATLASGVGSLRAVVQAAGAWGATMTPQQLFSINYTGTVNVLEAFHRFVGPGTVAICMSSVGAHRTSGMAAVDEILLRHRGPDLWSHVAEVATDLARTYAVAKRGVMLECEVRAAEWGQRGGRVVSISPGNFDTEMGRAGRAAGAADLFVEASSAKRPGTPDEMAALVAFLVSTDAAYISGCDIRVDGAAVANLRHAPALHDAYDRWNGVFG
jgi:NAD(P)-dependent dehydrogenase (short-subunit alcohol dehydrogenase family)